MAGIKDIMGALNKEQSKANWEKFGKAVKSSGLKYYHIEFDKSKVNELEDLRKAHADLYDSKEKLVYKIPIIMENGKKIRGATIYLKGLLNLNK
ncbi:MAG: hypothetical protein KGH64_00425 [Candidatus Micrarchaeota archaeon]|nr:hypothetical protein [Candidatus Micrarchaeota archaeon]MDE1833781.1 hypothetical protein [Candidatus Micrarchaeota archaeon]MDE1858931.1 hypothetical protein [Candidatus Micrarchaeota archaeon]